MIINFQAIDAHVYAASTDSLERPGNTVQIIVGPDKPIGEIIAALNEVRGRPK